MNLASLAQLVGLALVTAGVALISIPFALVVGGACLVLVGFVQEL